MNGVLDNALVAAVLLVSAVYASVSLGPKALRRHVLAALAMLTGAAPAFLGLARVTRRLQTAAESKAAGACGGCDNCGSERPAAESKIGDASVPARPEEIKIPLAGIRRRQTPKH